jgi:hypothetical protein
MVGAVVAELHLHRLRARGEPEELVAQADSEDRGAGADDLADRLDGVVARLRIPGAVGEEDAVGLQRQRILRRRGRGKHRDPAAALGQVAKDVVLHAVVERDHVEFRASGFPVAGA